MPTEKFYTVAQWTPQLPGTRTEDAGEPAAYYTGADWDGAGHPWTTDPSAAKIYAYNYQGQQHAAADAARLAAEVHPNPTGIYEMDADLLKITNAWEQQRRKRIANMRARAQAKRQEADRRQEQADRTASYIPLGQPILVGHHSEKRHRRDLDRIHRGYQMSFELQQEADELDRRAEAAEQNTTISSDNPDAPDLIAVQIAELEARQERMKAINKATKNLNTGADWVNGPGWQERLAAKGITLTEAEVKELMSVIQHQRYYAEHHGGPVYPPYALSNNSANIRRLKARAATIAAHADDTTSEQIINGLLIVDNVDDNRLQIFYSGKPAEEVRKALKARGFKWAPSAGAWQRQRSNQASYYARIIAEEYGDVGN